MALQTLIDTAVAQTLDVSINPPLTVRNQNSNIAEFYELSVPYALIFETVSHSATSSILFATQDLTSGSSIDFHRQKTHDNSGFLLNRPLHKHDFLEIMYVIQGELKQRIEDNSFLYSAGQCCVLNSHILHAEDFSTDFTAIFIMLSHSFLREHFQHCMHLIGNSKDSLKNSSLYHMFSPTEHQDESRKKEYIDFVPIVSTKNFQNEIDSILENMLLETIYPKPGSIYIFEGLLDRLLSYFDNKLLYKKTIKIENNKNREDIFINITHLLEASYGRVNRKELEQQLNYSADYLNKIVKLNTGMSLIEYGRLFMLKNAESLLLYSELSVGDIIQKLGFSNRSYFYRLFQSKHNMTPSDFRNKHRAR